MKSKSSLTPKFKFSRSVGLISALLLIGVGALFVYITRADTGDTSPIQVTMTSTPSVDNQIVYYVTVTNTSPDPLREIKLSVPLPQFDTTYLAMGITTQLRQNWELRPDSEHNLGPSTTCGSSSYNRAGWPGSPSHPDVGCPHWSWAIDYLLPNGTHEFSFKVGLRSSLLPYPQPKTWASSAWVQIFDVDQTFNKRLVFSKDRSQSNLHHVTCSSVVATRLTSCNPSAGL